MTDYITDLFILLLSSFVPGILIDNSETFNEYDGEYVEVNDDIYLIDTNTTLVGGVMSVSATPTFHDVSTNSGMCGIMYFLQDRSITIATYALCGFANLSSIGTVIGVLGSMAPEKQGAISGMAVRAMITGTIVSFMNACIAGLLYSAEIAES